MAAALAVTLMSTPAAIGSASSAAGRQTDGRADVQRVLTEQLEDSGVPGGAYAVTSSDGTQAGGAGRAGSGREVGAETPFVIGSASKSVTALAVMQLVDAGLVDLDAPVRDYVPELRLADGQPVDAITVRHLLQQTSGLDDLAGGPMLASAADGTPLEAVAELQGAELASTPGTTWLYANVNYVLAGLVVESASGLSYGEYVEQEIFTPLGMSHSSANTEPVAGTTLVEGHRFWFGIPVGTDPMRRDATVAAGYLVSTAGDLGRYLSLYLADGVGPGGTRIVSASGMRTLFTPGPQAHLGPWSEGQDSRYAMGWFVGGPWGEDAIFHPGNTPDSSTMLTLFPEQGLGVASVVNAGNELPVPGNPFIADRVNRNVVHAALGQPPAGLPSVKRFYLVFDLVVLLLTLGAAWAVLRSLREVRSPSPRHRGRGWFGVLVRALAAALLLLLPTLSYGWAGLWTWAPDLAVVLATLAALLATACLLRAISLLRAAPGSTTFAPRITEGKPHHVSA